MCSSNMLTSHLQFRTRYKDCKIALTSLRSTKGLIKKLGLTAILGEGGADTDSAVSKHFSKRGRKNKKLLAIEGSEEENRILDAISNDGRFIDLCAILPPLPKKGSFDVKTIKNSQYFFS